MFILVLIFVLVVLVALAFSNGTSTSTQSNRETRNFNGVGNNEWHPEWGATNTPLKRKSHRPNRTKMETINPRVISNAVHRNDGADDMSTQFTGFVAWWGQFLAHEIDLTKTSTEKVEISTSSADVNESFPGRIIEFTRSERDSDGENPNHISSYIDSTNVYGSSDDWARALRRMDGTGKLKTETSENGEVIPLTNKVEFDVAKLDHQDLKNMFLVGDIRGNETTMLLSMHTVFLREHNRLCDLFVASDPSLAGRDETIYQMARRRITGYMQHITCNEWLPIVTGRSFDTKYAYDPTVDPSIVTEFSTSAFRFGHTVVPQQLGPLTLLEAFFNPDYVRANGCDIFFSQAQNQAMKKANGKMNNTLRNNLFGAPTSEKLLDLATLNIRRAEDHDIPTCNVVRRAYGLPEFSDWDDVTNDSEMKSRLQSVYTDPSEMNLWTACMVQTPVSGGLLGDTAVAIISDQFIRLIKGDRFWYRNNPNNSASDISDIEKTTFGDIVNRNVQPHVRRDVFRLL